MDLDSSLIVPQLPFEVHCDAHLILMPLESTVRMKTEANGTETLNERERGEGEILNP